MRALVLRAIFITGSLSAVVIYIWGVELSAIVGMLAFLFVVVFAMIVPAALFVAILKLVPYLIAKAKKRSNREEP